ncbi:MAG: hypothetical protein ISP41_16825 [Alphaproteobacteria bacterium]|nr:hypothetical protein [Alphaproteobacteria bacterium]
MPGRLVLGDGEQRIEVEVIVVDVENQLDAFGMVGGFVYVFDQAFHHVGVASDGRDNGNLATHGAP